MSDSPVGDRRVAPWLLTVVLVCGVLCSTTVRGAGPPTDRSRLFAPDSGPIVFNPRSVEVGPNGTIALWDEGLQQYVFLPPGNENGSSSSKQTTNSMSSADTLDGETSFSGLIDQYFYAHGARRMVELPAPRGFWDQRGRFWILDPARSDRPGTTPLRLLYGDTGPVSDTTTREIPFSAREIVPSGRQWWIQDSHGRIRAWNPDVQRDPLNDTPVESGEVRGRLIGVSPDGLQFVRDGTTIRVFQDGLRKQSRTFPRLNHAAYSGGQLYVLVDERQILRLSPELGIKNTFDLNGSESVLDFDVWNQRIYLIDHNGVHTARLDESKRYFFWASQTLDLQTMARRLPPFFRQTGGRRLFLHPGNPSSVDVQIGDRRLRRFTLGDTGIQKRQRLLFDQISDTEFQFYQSDSTFWNGTDRLYYFFRDEHVVESYDQNGRLLQRTVCKFDQFDIVKEVRFLGASGDHILFSAELIYPRRGFQRTVLVFNWEGSMLRAFRLHHPQGSNRGPELRKDIPLRYDGRGHIYALHDRYIQQYDLMGYPSHTFRGVTFPVDIAATDHALVILDLNGWRINRIPASSPIHFRYASSPGGLSIRDVAPISSQQTILSARTSTENRLHIKEYRNETREYETVLKHPRRNLRYPSVSAGGDTLYFWGRRSNGQQWTLYQSDLIRYEARPVQEVGNVRGPVVHNPVRQLLIVPVERSESPPSRFRYLGVEGETGWVQNTGDLISIARAEDTGFYGVWKSGKRYVVGRGTLRSTNSGDTGGWAWEPTGTVARLDHPLEQLYVQSDGLFISADLGEDMSRLGRLTGLQSPTPGVEWLYEGRGTLNWARFDSDRYLVFHGGGSDRGYLFHLYSSSDPPTGGLQGDLSTSAPFSLSDISLRTDPGGFLIRTGKGGSFSLERLPTGYQRVIPNSYRYYFSYPFRVSIRKDRFTVRRGVEIQSEEDILLMEKGLTYFQNGDLRRARISLEAFMQLVEQGPAFRWTEMVLKEINQKQGRMNDLMEIYRRSPELFDPVDRIRMLQVVVDSRHRRTLLESFLPTTVPYWNRLIRYRLGLIRNDRSILRPIYPPRHGFPVLSFPAKGG